MKLTNQNQNIDQQVALIEKPMVPEIFQGNFKIIEGETSEVNIKQVKILHLHYIPQSKEMDLGERNRRL